MQLLIEFLKVLNTLSPLAVIALLGTVLFYQAKSKAEAKTDFTALTDNHLHELPLILETLMRIERNEAAAFSTIIARLED